MAKNGKKRIVSHRAAETGRTRQMPRTRNSEETHSPLFNNSLAKGLQMLASFKTDRRGLSLAELAEVSRMTKSSAQRCAFTLEALGYLAKDPRSRKYVLSPKILELGHNYIHNNLLVELANPYLHRLNNQTGETVNLAEPFGANVIFSARFQSSTHLMSYMSVGTVLPMYCSSSGRAIMSSLALEQQEKIIDNSDLVPYTQKTITDKGKLLKLLRQSQTEGFAYTMEEFFPDDLSLACPIINADKQAIGAINISVPASRWTLDNAIATFIPQLKQVAFTISSFRGL